jgi:hypothetical protein
MKILKSLAIAFCVGLFLITTSIRADEWDQKTKITFSGPVRVAKTELPAGTYTFKLADTNDRHVVQIFNEDETHLITTVLTNADFRLEPSDKTVVKFYETSSESEASGTVPESGVPIRAWFYPGDQFGHDFKVTKIHGNEAEVQQPAVTETAALAPETPAPTPEAAAPVEPAPPATPEVAAPEPVAPAAPAEDLAAQPQETQPAPAAPEQKSEPSELPQTASDMPLVGLIGFLSLGVVAGFRSLCGGEFITWPNQCCAVSCDWLGIGGPPSRSKTAGHWCASQA